MAESRVKLETNAQGVEYYFNTDTKLFEWRVPDVREIIRAKSGYKILSADFSQIEIKIMAFLSQDSGLKSAINSGKDIHSYFTTDLFGQQLEFSYELLSAAKKDDSHARHKELVSLRSGTKTIVFAVPYGAGPYKIALKAGFIQENLDAGMSMEDAVRAAVDKAAEFMERYLSQYPSLKAWLKAQGENALILGYTESVDGRKRFYYIPEIDHPNYDEWVSQIKRWAGNQPIQATSADMLKRAIVYIYKTCKARNLHGTLKLVVHDEIVMEWPDDEAEEGKTVMADSMNKAYDYYINGIVNTVSVVAADIWQKD